MLNWIIAQIALMLYSCPHISYLYLFIYLFSLIKETEGRKKAKMKQGKEHDSFCPIAVMQKFVFISCFRIFFAFSNYMFTEVTI